MDIIHGLIFFTMYARMKVNQLRKVVKDSPQGASRIVAKFDKLKDLILCFADGLVESHLCYLSPRRSVDQMDEINIQVPDLLSTFPE